MFFSNFGVAYTSRIADIPASTGYGEPIQRFFKLKDGERIVAAFSLDPRVAGNITPRKEGAEPPVHAIAVTSDGYSLRFSLEPFAEPSTRSGRRYARAADGAEFVGVARLTGGEILIAATREARAILCKADEVNFLSGPGRGVILIKLSRIGPRARVHRLDGGPRSDDGRDQPRRRADNQHDQLRGDGPRRQGARAPPARPVHPGRDAARRRLRRRWPNERPARHAAVRIAAVCP